MASKYKRSRLLVDNAFQLRLLARMAAYFFIYVLAMLHVGFVIELMQGLAADGIRVGVADMYAEFIWRYKPLLLSFVLIAPIIFYDLLKFSNRVAGPLFRCRRIMSDMAEGKPVCEFVPRKGDLMAEFFQAFNALINVWNEKTGETKQQPTPSSNGKSASTTHSAV